MDHDTTIKTTVIEAIADACNLPSAEISVDLNIQDLGLDSWAITAVVARIETAYGTEITTDQLIDLMQAEIVGDFIALVEGIAGAPRHAQARGV